MLSEKDTGTNEIESTIYNRAYSEAFAPSKLRLGLFLPLEAYLGDVPTMIDHLALAHTAENLGFSALWSRDIPLRDPSFGDVGQIFDPWVYLGFLAASTSKIVLATGSIITTLRHPIDLAKAAASVDNLSGGRLLLGIASGDRPSEFPAYGISAQGRGDRFRQGFEMMEELLYKQYPDIQSPLGTMTKLDVIPKPTSGRIPKIVTGSSRQSLDWIASNADGWLMYPQAIPHQKQVLAKWKEAQERVGVSGKPFAQSLYIDLSESADERPTPIHLGYRLGRLALAETLMQLREIGVNHVGLNLKFSTRPAIDVLHEIGAEVLPHFG